MICPRCQVDSFCSSMSWFTQDMVCCDCRDDERAAPNYLAARTAELASIRRGEIDFPGIGLAPDDVAVLEALRLARQRIDALQLRDDQVW